MRKLIFFLLTSCFTLQLMAQESNTMDSKYLPMVTFTAAQDHDNMMEQLSIKDLRPGPSGNDADPNHANTNELLANPCPLLPDILINNNGKM